ncbi:MAG TPA: hypothetical protein VLW44_13420 [Streptosporangiaceae bacterium]|nr:hypothetical protein [Streptosporangiaceae bacterium]
MSENQGTAGPDLEAAVAQMPFAAALGVVLGGGLAQVRAVLGGDRGR